jgi:kynureninase
MRYKATLDFAHTMDANDPLREFRNRFHIPPTPTQTESVYLCGHSLGLQPISTRDYLEAELLDWQNLAVKAHFEGQRPWMYYHELVTDSLARLTGAQSTEVVAMNSLTANLHLMMISFYRPTLDRHKILIEGPAFPSDRYALVSQMRYHNLDPAESLIEVSPTTSTEGVSTEQILAALQEHGEDVALVLLSPVNFTTGQLLDIRTIVKVAHAHGCKVGLDLAHSIGNIVLKLHEWDVDFAVWCSYKYLNAGPGGIGGCFVHSRYADDNLPRLAGWWGHNQQTRFQMPPEFDPILGAEGWQLSNPPIMCLASLRASLALFDEVGIEKLRAKSRLLTGYLEFLIAEIQSKQIQQLTPQDPSQRGCQLSFQVKGGRIIHDRLQALDIVCDWREPDILRLAPVPFYNSFSDVFQTAECFKQVLSQ